MPGSCGVLRNHRLHYLREVGIDESMAQARFEQGCSTGRCRGACCTTGVWVDLAERDRILENADLVRDQMEPGQEPDAGRWFEAEIVEDPDFPSGRAAGTRVQDGACVFLDSAGRCVLQKASYGRPLNLKPFFCKALPITIEGGRLALEEGWSAECCAQTEGGALDVFDVCGEELRHVLGEGGVAELRSRIRTSRRL